MTVPESVIKEMEAKKDGYARQYTALEEEVRNLEQNLSQMRIRLIQISASFQEVSANIDLMNRLNALEEQPSVAPEPGQTAVDAEAANAPGPASNGNNSDESSN